MDIGRLRHRVTLQTPGPAIPDGDGGYTDSATTLVSRAPAEVEPATASSMERIGANTVTASASHLVTLRYVPGVTTKTRAIVHDVTDREFSITGIFDEAMRHRVLVLACVERVI